MIVNELVQPCLVIYMELTAQKEKATGKKGPVTVLELRTYTLSRSFTSEYCPGGHYSLENNVVGNTPEGGDPTL